MRLVTFRRRTATGDAGSVGALSGGGVLDLSSIARLDARAAGRRRPRRGAPGARSRRPRRRPRRRGAPRAAAAAQHDPRLHAHRGAREELVRRGPRGLVRDPRLLEGQPGHGPRPGGDRPVAALHGQARLRARGRGDHRAPGVAGDRRGGGGGDRRLHGLQRLERARHPVPRDAGQPRPRAGQGLRQLDRAVHRDARRVRHRDGADGGPRERRDVGRGRARLDALHVRPGHRAPVPGAAAPARRPPRQRHGRSWLRSGARPLDRAGRRRRAGGAGHRSPAQHRRCTRPAVVPEQSIIQRSTHA